ncbi:MAG: aminopeptidase P family protein [Bacteroidetes bacterium]|jgi:Xaa-Pro aminopeptidase|nr:aminopeptidase P family protein [Bacteroidota bacterium]MBT4410394.1 aminopeptidase P family protein [Bacteroidota bacterium]MBT5427825.1 aminopeptidase P family protein [Bacteroidota bacterium]MBT7464232.1 aminopeptidase P family protein [Bacteroidota bacterium]
MSINKKVGALRELLVQNNLDAVIIPSTDPHMGEYVPEHWAEREWISGFTGSAGTVVITKDFAGLWTDSRYFVQAEEQLSDSVMELVKLTIPHTPEHIIWLINTLPAGSRIAINGNMVPASMIGYMQDELNKKNFELLTDLDLISAIWKDRPSLPANKIIKHKVEFAGQSRTSKLDAVGKLMTEAGATHHLVCTLDEIAWLFNLRGTDVEFNPLFVSYALIGPEHSILFINRDKIHYDLLADLLTGPIRIMDYDALADVLQNLPPESSLLLDPGKTNQTLVESIPHGIRIIEGMGLVTGLKAIKNKTELDGLRNVMVKDGVAWVKFLCWLDQNIGQTRITELSAANHLAALREEQENYQGPSFHPISSYGIHGSIVHYAVDEESNIELHPEGIYLCDTGGQYLDGTTDTTRTITLGKTTEQQKSDFTLALKGTLGVSMLRFPEGTKGYQMDILARKALWDHGLTYGHGTGHGVGFFLNVHEGPQTIGTGASGNMNTSFQPGMVTTVEPAIYREGSHGMRTENMTVCIEDIKTEFGQFYSFETLTLAPIDRNLIKKSLLSDKEIDWLNVYHQKVYDKLHSFLNNKEREWLKNKTGKL